MTSKVGLLLRALALSTTVVLPLAHAAVIDFEGEALTGLYFDGDSFMQGDYTLKTVNSYGTIDTAGALGAQAPVGNDTQFYFNSNDGSLLLLRTDGGVFDLTGFSAAFVPLAPASSQTTVLVIDGSRADGSGISTFVSFTLGSNGKYTFSAYDSILTGLTQVKFHACSYVADETCTVPTMNNGQFAIDNLVVSAVPESTTTTLLALGLLGLGLARRTRHS